MKFILIHKNTHKLPIIYQNNSFNGNPIHLPAPGWVGLENNLNWIHIRPLTHISNNINDFACLTPSLKLITILHLKQMKKTLSFARIGRLFKLLQNNFGEAGLTSTSKHYFFAKTGSNNSRNFKKKMLYQ